MHKFDRYLATGRDGCKVKVSARFHPRVLGRVCVVVSIAGLEWGKVQITLGYAPD